MAKRFSRYKFALKANGGATGGALKKYNDFITGNSEYTRKTSTGSGAMVERGVAPFSLNLGTNTLLVALTERALTRMTAIGLSETILELKTTDDTTLPAGISPAKIAGAKGITGVPDQSKITGVAYKRLTTDAFVSPFGAKGATQKYGEAVKIIKDAVEASSKNHSVSFTPERILMN